MVILENTKINNMEFIPELTQDYIKEFIRDTENDIIYTPQNMDTRQNDYPLFYFVDCKNNMFVAYNKNLTSTGLLSKYKYKEEYGCIYFLCNTDSSYNVNIRNIKEVDTFINLGDKTFYNGSIECC